MSVVLAIQQISQNELDNAVEVITAVKMDGLPGAYHNFICHKCHGVGTVFKRSDGKILVSCGKGCVDTGI